MISVVDKEAFAAIAADAAEEEMRVFRESQPNGDDLDHEIVDVVTMTMALYTQNVINRITEKIFEEE